MGASNYGEGSRLIHLGSVLVINLFWGGVIGSVGMLLSVPFTMIAKIVLEQNPDTRWIAIFLGAGGDLPEIDSEIAK